MLPKDKQQQIVEYWAKPDSVSPGTLSRNRVMTLIKITSLLGPDVMMEQKQGSLST